MQGLCTENHEYYWEKFKSAAYTMLMNYKVQFLQYSLQID